MDGAYIRCLVTFNGIGIEEYASTNGDARIEFAVVGDGVTTDPDILSITYQS